MRTLALQHSPRLLVFTCLVVLLAVNLVIVSSTTQNISAHLQSTESRDRRAVKETYNPWPPVGLVWGFALIQIPLWPGIAIFLLAADVTDNRVMSRDTKLFLWGFSLILAFSGCLMFLLTRGEEFSLLGPSFWRYTLLILSALPAGALSSAVRREERWATLAPTLVGFFIVALCIAGSDVSHI